MNAAMKKPAYEGRANPNKSGQLSGYDTTGPADVHRLLARLDKVKQTRSDAWQACCPAHDDRSPSLNIRMAEDGKMLVRCWAGCSAADIMAAVGLELSDLFPRRERDTWSRPVAASQRWVPRDVLSSIASEALITLIAAEDIRQGKTLPDADIDRLAVAAGRLRSAAREVGCYDR